jgi:hypothetical protein
VSAEPARRIRPKRRADLNAIHHRREQLEALGLRLERAEELHHDPDGGVKVVYIVSERLQARDS